MTLKRLAAICAAVVWLWAGLVWAKPGDFYQTTVEVASQSASARSRAAAVGLERVLVRLSGSREVAGSSAVAQALQNAARYVEQYQYIEGRDELGGRQELMAMSFSPQVIEQLLRDAGLPYWSTNRPQVLVWLVKDTAEGGKQLVNDPSAPLLAALLKEAEERGLPVQLPLLDLDDQLALTAEKAWALDEEALLQASDRYDANVILAGRYTQNSAGEWLVSWQHFVRGTWHASDLRAPNPAAVAEAAMDPLADKLAELYAVAPGRESTSLLQVQLSGLNSFADFRGALEYLNELALVGSYQLRSQVGDVLLMELQMNGDLQQFQNALALDGRLELERSATAPSTPTLSTPLAGGELLRLRWTGGAG